MENLYENAANDFLELASEQRLNILFNLLSNRSKISNMAKEVGATVQEVHRNFERLADAGLISKDKDGYYGLTTYGKTICTQVPDLVFVSKNRKYFETHDFGDIPMKFIQRIGALAAGQHIKGFVKVMEQWKTIYKNADEYIFEILSEVPLDLIEPIISRIKHGIKFNYIFSESTIIPKGRKQLLEKLGFKKLLEQGLVERKMQKNVNVVVVLNEKEACVMFPTIDGDADIGEMFYSRDHLFHEWCLDYFRYCWYGSDIFQESKLKE
ncbi:MAG TPA: transcriptional regulator [Nitrosopumilaceae archaeon]|nr:transcriptional regulator [Nitrosopumilaceae archaeon]